MPSRFVIHEHCWNGVHWDVMLERGESLRTWAIDEPIEPNRSQPARLLPDHRSFYLDYEGPVSGERGTIRKLAEGTYETLEWTEERVVVSLVGDQLTGEVTFSRGAGGGWSFFLMGNVD